MARVLETTLAGVRLEDRAVGLLELEEERILARTLAFEVDDPRARPHTAHANDLERRVHVGEPLGELLSFCGQRCDVLPEGTLHLDESLFVRIHSLDEVRAFLDDALAVNDHA